MSWPFDTLQPLKYGVILADPPWAYLMRSEKGYEKSPESHYETMDLDTIKALPVSDLAAGDCLLFLWSTWPHLLQAAEVMRAWGFTYKTGGSWFKKTATGKPAFGTGYILRSSCEPYLVGSIGQPFIRSRSERNGFETDDLSEIPDRIDSVRREHSRKPPEMREIIERLCPHAFGTELFAREPWAGYDTWGNQTELFAEAG